MNRLINKARWAADRSRLWSRSAINLTESDRLLVSFPKAGSTWVRYFLCEILCQRSDQENMSMDVTNRLMPEFAHSSLFLPWLFKESPRIIKTHQKHNFVFGKKAAALIVRDPRDIAVSYYHYATGSKDYNFEGSVSDILRHPRMGAEACLSHYASWRNYAQLILKYEEIKSATLEQFSKLLDFYGIERSDAEIQQAIQASDFSAMKKAQAKSKALKAEFKEGYEFVRSGKRAQWKELFSDEDLAYYKALRVKYDFNLYE
jgi:estrone sulfotransferase